MASSRLQLRATGDDSSNSASQFSQTCATSLATSATLLYSTVPQPVLRPGRSFSAMVPRSIGRRISSLLPGNSLGSIGVQKGSAPGFCISFSMACRHLPSGWLGRRSAGRNLLSCWLAVSEADESLRRGPLPPFGPRVPAVSCFWFASAAALCRGPCVPAVMGVRTRRMIWRRPQKPVRSSSGSPWPPVLRPLGSFAAPPGIGGVGCPRRRTEIRGLRLGPEEREGCEA
mmetsp:Transcript_29199/g.69720  ORF Transcript_29199/g.69720 Transcript_29199/m.69720 type:complete len:229 (-) Transcript_29199:1156-1842(-)